MKNKLAAYTAALNAYDLDAVEAMFAEDAVYVSEGVGGMLEGRAVIMAAFRAYFAQHTDQVNEDFEVFQIDEFSLQGKWRLRSVHSNRQGRQRVTYNLQGLISNVEVAGD